MDAASQRVVAGIPSATPDSPTGTALRVFLAEQARVFLTPGSGGTRLFGACRRTSSVLTACRSLVDADWAAELCGEVDRIADRLAAERDAEAVRGLILTPLNRWTDSGSYPDGGAARARTLLTRMLDRDRTAAHSAATSVLVARSFHALADRMATLALEVPMTTAADASCAEVLPMLLEAARGKLVRRVASLPDPLGTEGLAADPQWFAALEVAESALHVAELCEPTGIALGTLGGGGDGGDRGGDGGGSGGGARPAPDADLVRELTGVIGALRDQHLGVLAARCVHRAADTPRIAASTGYVLGRLHEEQRLAVLRARCAAPLSFARPERLQRI